VNGIDRCSNVVCSDAAAFSRQSCYGCGRPSNGLAAERKYLLTWTAEMNGLAVIEAAPATNLHPFHESCSLERIVWMITDNRNLQIQAAGNFF
jgi:hypothetical protein